MEIRLKTLTPIWTGDAEKRNTRLRETGIIGSLRWWCEALVRGLGGYACDPTSDKRCELKQEQFHKAIKAGKTVQEALDEQICPVCQLFGCTGWGKKFRLSIKTLDGRLVERLGRNTNFNLIFIEQKRITPQEKSLLKKTIKLIVEYGALGAKIALKPSEVPGKNIKKNHLDYGIVTYQNGYKLGKTANIAPRRPKENDPDWPNLQYFWFIHDNYLNRKQINDLVNRNDKGRYGNPCEFEIFLGGCIKREKFCPQGVERMSKKIFSFHGQGSGGRRCFGYVRNEEELKKIKGKLRDILGNSISILTWEDIRNAL